MQYSVCIEFVDIIKGFSVCVRISITSCCLSTDSYYLLGLCEKISLIFNISSIRIKDDTVISLHS